MDDETYWTEETVTHEGEESRQPTVEDLLELCRELNARGAKYLIVGGFAIRGAGYLRETGDVEKYTVVRIADEIIVDLMKSASGIGYDEASKEVVIREVQGVPIPFASPRLLWRMKKNTRREKDAADLVFLRQQYPEVTQD